MTKDASNDSYAVQTIEDYLAKLPAPWAEVTGKLLDLIREAAPELEESIDSDHPVFFRDGTPVCGVAAGDARVELWFSAEASLDDPDGLVAGEDESGRRMAAFSTLHDVQAQGLRGVIRSAARRG